VPPEDGRLTPETCTGLRNNKVFVKVKVYYVGYAIVIHNDTRSNKISNLNLLVCVFTGNTLSSQLHAASKRKHPNPTFIASPAYYERCTAPPTIPSFGQYIRSKGKCLASSFRGSRYILLRRQTPLHGCMLSDPVYIML
jgi:hypothetical protein